MQLHLTMSARGRARRVLAALLVCATAGATLALAAPAQAQGDATATHTKLVNPDPSDFTPFVKDGIVASVVQVGDQIVIGGTFTQVVKGTTTFTRSGLAAFNATTGAVSTTFAPVLNGEVTSLAVAADGQSVYAAGAFNTVNGVTRKKVALINVSNGALVTAFKATGITAVVNDVRLVGGTLWIAGAFANVSSTSRRALATLNATTGALTSQSTVVFAGLHNGGSTNIRELAVTPDGSKLIAIGNFTTVNGLPRDQVVLLDISGATAAVSGWQTNFFTSTCASAFDTFMRDVAVSPDGTYAIFATTGAYRVNTSCDTISRFEITGTSAGVTPTWINMTGGDTTTAVAVVGSVVYIGGHFRWVNNPQAGDRAGQGAIERTGLAALDPENGLPFDWNPTRERGYGVYDFLATDQGLWVGSDTDGLGYLACPPDSVPMPEMCNEYHPRIGLLPLAGGSTLPANTVGSLPGDVIAVSPGATTNNTLSSTVVDAAGHPGSTSAVSGSDTWSNARGAMLIDGTLYTAWSDRGIYAASLNGSSVGAKQLINANAGPSCTSGSGSCSGAFSLDAGSITSMFYDSGRMYYTMSGVSSLYYRYFQPESGIVGATRYSATGAVSTLNPSRVRGMFLAGGQLYFADATTGDLLSIGFSGGVVGGSLATVDTSRDWQARGLALRGQPAANQPPNADIDASCAFLDCQFDSTGSGDSDGSIVSRSWNFGDGESSTQSVVNHTYAAAGTYTVTLTVTDNDGASDSATYSAVVAEAPASAILPRASATGVGSANTAKVTVPGTVQANDMLLLFVSVNGATTTTPPSGWTLVREQTDEMVTRVYSRTAVASDAGTAVTITLGAIQKYAVTLVAYSGVLPGSVPVATSSPESGTTAAHTAPAVAVTVPGSWVVRYWGDKTAATTGWTVPGNVMQRALVLGSGSGQVGGVTADSNGAVPTGTAAASTATSTTSGGKATSFSIVLAPA